MDLRVIKTERSIRNAFLELRAKKALEQIKVKELCDAACINKSTFYAHYRDIYDLSDTMETETVKDIVNSIPKSDNILENNVEFSKNLCLAFLSQSALTGILFSGNERNRFVGKIEEAVMNLIQEYNPVFSEKAMNRVLLGYTIHGTYSVMMENPDIAPDKLISMVEKVMRSIGPLFEK